MIDSIFYRENFFVMVIVTHKIFYGINYVKYVKLYLKLI